jgi:hypothetical protein
MKVEELWVYPVKACRGVKVNSSKVTATGLEWDRIWCVVDEKGTVIAKMEAISQRKLPILATITVELLGGDDTKSATSLRLSTPGMPAPLVVPAAEEAYDKMPTLQAECSGRSTTAAAGEAPGEGGWWLGSSPCKRHAAGSEWLTTYLNQPVEDGDGELLRSGKTTRGSFALVRMIGGGVDMEQYPPVFPFIEKARTDPAYKARFAGNKRPFTDFAPFLVVNRASAAFVAERAEVATYPLGSFRGNIVVGPAEAWAEESWGTMEIGGLPMRKIKECPRCTVPPARFELAIS